MLLEIRFITGICYFGWLVISTLGQDVKMATFSCKSSWPDGNTKVESMAVIRCAAKCLSVPSCKAFTYDGDDQLCSLHNTLLVMDQNKTANKPHARYVQMVPNTCDEYLVSGVRYRVPDSAFSSSSEWSSDLAHIFSRLDTQAGGGAWVARHRNKHQWIAVDLGDKRQITGVTTQGRPGTNQWVTSYTIAHGNDPSQFQMYTERTGQDKVFPGNIDRSAKVTNMLKFPFTARYVRIHPKTWLNYVSMRFDLVGCAV